MPKAAPTIQMRAVADLHPDPTNPRKPDQARMALLQLSIRKLGFLMPVFAERSTGLLLSGHQRLTVSLALGIEAIPVALVDVKDEDIKGINVLFNRGTNDFTAFDTGSKSATRLGIEEVIAAAEQLPDADHTKPFAINFKSRDIRPFTDGIADQYDKKAVVLAASLIRLGIEIPIVVTKSGRLVNGVHRVFAALESKRHLWPVVVIPDTHGDVAAKFLNYLSMDFHVDDDFKRLFRYSAFRRPANNRGALPKAYRFWANGHRTLPDRDSYSTQYWRQFRDTHGKGILDFGAGLGKVAPFLRSKGFEALDFEPYRIDPQGDVGTPSPAYSKQMAGLFLEAVADASTEFDSIFLASVLNSIPFAYDRMCVLAIVHALCLKSTGVYGTCRDLSDFNYEYGGIRNANYFTFDSEPGVRVGDVMRSPKIQKFETQDSARAMFTRLWNGIEFWPGGNVFYYRLTQPKGSNPAVLGKALELEFDLPYADGTGMGLVKQAKAAFGKRLGIKIA